MNDTPPCIRKDKIYKQALSGQVRAEAGAIQPAGRWWIHSVALRLGRSAAFLPLVIKSGRGFHLCPARPDRLRPVPVPLRVIHLIYRIVRVGASAMSMLPLLLQGGLDRLHVYHRVLVHRSSRMNDAFHRMDGIHAMLKAPIPALSIGTRARES